jgi:protein SEY1
LDLIPLYAKISPKDTSLLPDFSESKPFSQTSVGSSEDLFDFEESLTVLSETKVLNLTDRFRRDADAFYVEAKRSTVSSIAQIPPWMYGVLVVLGWNEAMTVLFNPMYFMMMLFGLSAT